MTCAVSVSPAAAFPSGLEWGYGKGESVDARSEEMSGQPVTEDGRRFRQTILVVRLAVGLSLLGVMYGLTGCADTRKGTFRTKSGYEETFRSAVEALNSVGFAVKASDVNTGVVSGEKTALVRWYGRTTTPVRINVTVKRVETRAEVDIAVVPPELAYGSTKIIFDDYVYALKSRVSDLAIVSVQEG